MILAARRRELISYPPPHTSYPVPPTLGERLSKKLLFHSLTWQKQAMLRVSSQFAISGVHQQKKQNLIRWWKAGLPVTNVSPPSPVSAGFRVNQPPPPPGVNDTEQGAASWGWYRLHDLQLLVSVRASGELDFHLYLTSTFLFILRQQRSKSFPSAYLCLITSGLSKDLLLRHTTSPHPQETMRITSQFPTFSRKERSWISKPPSATR